MNLSMRIISTSLFMILVAMIVAVAVTRPDQTSATTQQIPDEIKSILPKQVRDKGLEISTKLNPSHLIGDFDGDGKSDTAVLVKNKAGKIGIAITNSRSGKVFVVGAGTTLGNGGD